jgi:hypothetical protein
VPGAGIGSLVVVGALAGVLALLVIRSARPPEPRTAPLARGRLLSFSPASIRAVELSRGDQVVRFERSTSGWVDGNRQAIEDDRVDQFLRTLAEVERLEDVADEQATLADFGLEPPHGTIVLESDVETRIAVGERNPTLTGLYVQVAPDPHVVMVGAIVEWEFDKLSKPRPFDPADDRSSRIR